MLENVFISHAWDNPSSAGISQVRAKEVRSLTAELCRVKYRFFIPKPEYSVFM